MGWALIILLAAAVFVVLWRLGRLDRALLQLLGAALLIAMAGYAWQGRPGLAGRPAPPRVAEKVPDSAFAESREEVLGRFDQASRWLTIAEGYQRRGDTRSAVGVIQAGIRAHPQDSDLWVGLGNALVVHADGVITPAADLAFKRAAAIAPEHPGPKFFYGLALAQAGDLDQAEKVWSELLSTSPEDGEWRPIVAERLQGIAQARAIMEAQAPQVPQRR